LALKGGTGPVGTRATAAILLMATYALRISELARLRISDFDFQKKTLALRRSKNGQLQRYPLKKNVATAVRQYLKARPRNCAQLFLGIKPPYHPAEPKTFYHITHYRFEKLGIKTGRRGPHAIRHARAMELLRNGSSLKQIGDFLGHKHALSPLTYSKFTVESLREVAKFGLGGLV
jgi:integrase/recombinase XerD